MGAETFRFTIDGIEVEARMANPSSKPATPPASTFRGCATIPTSNPTAVAALHL